MGCLPAALATSRAILIDDRSQDQQERDAVHALDRERGAEAEEQRIARLPPELQEECAHRERRGDDDTEQKPFDHVSRSRISGRTATAAGTRRRHSTATCTGWRREPAKDRRTAARSKSSGRRSTTRSTAAGAAGPARKRAAGGRRKV